MNYLITGGTGFIGQHFIHTLDDSNDTVTILSRHKNKTDSKHRFIQDLSNIKSTEVFDVIINLAGSSIDRRWSASVKQDLINSRLTTTDALTTLVKRLAQKPKVMLSASAIGFYGADQSTPLDEESKPNDTFAHQLCQAWEKSAQAVEPHGVRLCILRLGVVLGKDGGALPKMQLPFKLGLGAKIGSGEQFFSWVHIADVIAAMRHLIHEEKCTGAYNITAPNPLSNTDFTKALADAVNRKTWLSIPRFSIKLMLGEMGQELLLSSQRILPKRLMSEHFHFNYDSIGPALTHLCR